MRGLDPTLKSVRAANYLRTLRRDLLKVSEACGVLHPGLIDIDDIAILDGQRLAADLRDVYGYQRGWTGRRSPYHRPHVEHAARRRGPDVADLATLIAATA